MQVLSLLLISFASVVRLSLGKEGNYNGVEHSLPENEWLNPYDMIHYDAAAQSLDTTVSKVSHLFTSLPKCELNVSPLNLLIFHSVLFSLFSTR